MTITDMITQLETLRAQEGPDRRIRFLSFWDHPNGPTSKQGDLSYVLEPAEQEESPDFIGDPRTEPPPDFIINAIRQPDKRLCSVCRQVHDREIVHASE